MVNNKYFFKALSDTTRLKIVKFLISGEKCVCEIHPHISRTQSTASIQLKKLEEWDIITPRRDGKYVYYSIKDKRIENIFNILKIKISKNNQKVACTNG